MLRFLSYIRNGLRAFGVNPGFSSVVVLTLALGVGVSSAVFSVASGTLINPTPWDEATELSLVWERNRGQESSLRPLAYGRFAELEGQLQGLSGIGAARGFNFVLTAGGESESIPGAYLTPGLFELLRLPIALGRPLGLEDADPRAPRTVVIDYSMWKNRYELDPNVLGRQIQIEGQDWAIVGVLGRDTWFPAPNTSILTALRPTPAELHDRSRHDLIVIGRRAAARSLEALRAELDLISQRSSEARTDSDEDEWPLIAQSVSEAMFGGQAAVGISILAGAIGFVLLIACANLTGLLLTRATARQREIAVRAAVGATRGQVVVQLLTENLVLALAAIPIGLVVTHATLGFIYTQVPVQVANVERLFRFDAPVWLFAAGAALSTAIVFGLTPSLHATRMDLSRALKEGGDRGASAAGTQRIRSMLVVGQLALSIVLLVGAALFSKSFSKVVNADTGFEMHNLFYAPVGLPESRYPEDRQRSDFMARLQERVSTVPGIVHVGVSDSAVSAGAGPLQKYEIASKRGERSASLETRWTAGSPGFIRALGLELRAGRYLSETDDAGSRRVALVSDLFVRASFRTGDDPIGEAIVLSDGSSVEIVGVVQDVNQIGLNATQRPQVYVPYSQQPSQFVQLVARTSVDPLSVGPTVRTMISELDPLIPVLRLTTALRERALTVWPLGLFASILGLLGGVGLVMATVGIYGVVRYATQQRSRELGIRAALGAEPRQLVLLVMRLTWVMTAAGLAFGLLLSLGLSSLLSSILYEIDPLEPLSLFGPAIALMLAALLAGALPAWRAASVDPTVALASD